MPAVFIPTPDEARQANVVAAIVAFSSLALSVPLVGLWIYFARDPVLKHHFNKTSTKLLYACVAISIPLALGLASTTISVGKHEKQFCQVGMVVEVFTFNMSNLLQCFICFNLIVALRWPGLFKYHLERWYYISSSLVSLLLSLLPLMADQYSWSTRTHSCWLNDVTTGLGFNAWQLAVLECPILIATILMSISTFYVAKHLLRQHREGKSHEHLVNQLFQPAFDSNIEDLTVTPDTNMNAKFQIEEVLLTTDFNPSLQSSPRTPENAKTPRTLGAWSSRPMSFVSNMRHDRNRPGTGIMPEIAEEASPRKVKVARIPMGAHFGEDPVAKEKREMRITILRISCYPIIHLVVSISCACGSLVLAASEHGNRDRQFSLYLFTFVGSAWVPLSYSICALLADMSLYNALAEKFRRHRELDEEVASLELALGRNKHRLSQLVVSSAGNKPLSPVVMTAVEREVSVIRTSSKNVSVMSTPIVDRRHSAIDVMLPISEDDASSDEVKFS